MVLLSQNASVDKRADTRERAESETLRVGGISSGIGVRVGLWRDGNGKHGGVSASEAEEEGSVHEDDFWGCVCDGFRDRGVETDCDKRVPDMEVYGACFGG